jgi:hypothetical protein
MGGEFMGGHMIAALRLFEALDVKFIPITRRPRPGSLETHAANVVDRIIRNHGLPHTTLTLRTVIESDGNQDALIADIIEAVSDVIRFHPRWANLGLEWLAAFDKIALIELRRKVKAAKVRPLKAGIATLICVELEKILGPAVLPKAPKPVRVRTEPNPRRSVTRIPEIERNISLGLQLLELRAKIKSHREFGRARRRLVGIDTQRAGHLMAVVRAFGTKPEVYRRLSWKALCDMSSPSFPLAARDALESRIVAGERAPEIRAARGAFKSGRPRHQPDQPAQRLAA